MAEGEETLEEVLPPAPQRGFGIGRDDFTIADDSMRPWTRRLSTFLKLTTSFRREFIQIQERTIDGSLKVNASTYG